MLFADDLGGWGAAAVGSLATAVLAGLGVLAVRLYRARGGYAKDVAEAATTTSEARRKARREDAEAEHKQESAILKEYKALVAAQRVEQADNRKQIHDLRDEMQVLSSELAKCRAGRARADERIAALEEALEEAGIPHRKWDPDGNCSRPHRPLPDPKSPAEEAPGE